MLVANAFSDLLHGITDAITDAYVDRDARKGSGPSDHAPIVVDTDFGG